MSMQQSESENRIEWAYREYGVDLSSYPVDMSSFLILPHRTFDAAGVPCQVNPAGFHPTAVAQYALAQWNEYLTTAAENHRKAFLTQAHWLIDHECRIGDDAGGWPISLPHPDFHTRGPWLSALTQGGALSVLLRAYHLT